jgi:8-oxo-dGTP pyrophosphatase MutT (NUDIX family)
VARAVVAQASCVSPARETYDGRVGDHGIRPLAVALIRRGDEILVEEGRDETKDETFFRLLGGTIEFGELGAEAIQREMWEELAAEIEVKACVATLENLFTWEGKVRHEIVLVYECTLNDPTLRLRDEWEAVERTPRLRITHKIAWKRTDTFGAGGDILYPEALTKLLRD